MKIIQVVGHKGSGKTTLASEIIYEFKQQGYLVGSIKHSSHNHELDREGKDSYLHRQAGAVLAAVMTRDMAAVYIPCNMGLTPQTLIETYYTGLDIVVIEGWISGPYPKIEVIRPENGKDPLFPNLHNVIAVVEDKALSENIKATAASKGLQILPRSDIAAINAFLLEKG